MDIFYDCEPSLSILCQIVDVGQGRQRNACVCLYSHRSYIVIDTPTCGACSIPLLAKHLHQVEILLVHPKTLKPSFMSWESMIPTYGLNKNCF